MAKLTRIQRRAIESALYHAERAERYVMSPETAVCRRYRQATTTEHYQRPDGAALYEVAREYGSDLTGLPQAIKELRELLK